MERDKMDYRPIFLIVLAFLALTFVGLSFTTRPEPIPRDAGGNMNSKRQGIVVSSGAVERFTASDFLIGKQYRIKYRDIYPTQGGLIPGIEEQVEVVAAANEEARGYGSLPADRAAAYWSRLVRVQIQSGRIILINPEDIATLEPL